MDQFDREDSSNYTSAQPRSTPPASEPAVERPTFTPVQPQKPKRSKAPLVLALLLLLALAGAGVFGWMWYQQNGELDNVRTDLSSQRNKVSQLETTAKANASLKDDTTAITTDTSSSDSEKVVKTALAYMEAPVKPTGDTREAKVEYLKGNFARVMVASTTVSGTSVAKIGTTLMLKKTNNEWIVLSAAEGSTSNPNELSTKYGFPQESFSTAVDASNR